jgi:hypothetical protein
MHADDGYEQWKQHRRRADVPAGFADRVMSAVRERERQRAGRLDLRARLLALLASRPARVGVCSLAVLAGVFRLLQVLGFFFPSYGL